MVEVDLLEESSKLFYFLARHLRGNVTHSKGFQLKFIENVTFEYLEKFIIFPKFNLNVVFCSSEAFIQGC